MLVCWSFMLEAMRRDTFRFAFYRGGLRQHHENELEGPKPAVGDMVCRRLYSNLQKEE